MVKFITHNGMAEGEINADSVSLITDDGTEVELSWRRKDKEISISRNQNFQER